jgi:hypothetical protein
MCGLAAVGVLTVGFGVAQAADICFEAEAANSISKPFEIAQSPTASGGKCVVQPLKSGRPPAVRCEAVYHFRVTSPGKYKLWGRALWPNGCANSVNVVLDKAKTLTLGQDGTYRRWHWVELKSYSWTLSRGEHTLQMQNREDGPAMDEFFLTTDADYVPVGIVHPSPNIIIH